VKAELLWWEGCPSTDEALATLRAALKEAGADPESVELREIVDDEQAERERFPGSPTIRIDGEDVVPPGRDDVVGLSCRVYRLADGRPSPTPDPADVRAAVRNAA
jgi:hypothetical protein